MGQIGLKNLVNTREALLEKLKLGLAETLREVNERILVCERNTISIAGTLDSISNHDSTKDTANSATFFGSMLFQRGVSGTRIVNTNDTKLINGHEFKGWGASTSSFGNVYFTAACSIGLDESEINVFLKRLRKAFGEFQKKRNKKKQESNNNVGAALDGIVVGELESKHQASQDQAFNLLKRREIK